MQKCITGHFTNLDTIVFDNEEEILVSKFFKNLETEIKKGNIEDCSYDAETETFYYSIYPNNYSIYVKKNTAYLRKLLTLISLKNEVKEKEIISMNEEKRKEKLIEEAKKGNIETEEAREVYLDYLKNRNKNMIFDFDFYFDFEEYFLKNLDEGESFSITVVGLAALTMFAALIGLLAWCFAATCAIPFITTFIIIPIITLVTDFFPFKILGYTEAVILTFMPSLIKNIFVNFSEIRTNIHKIKMLKKYSAPTKTINLDQKTNNLGDDIIIKQVNNIYLKLLQLDDENKKALFKELSSKIKEYQNSMKNISSGLTILNENYIQNSFIAFLSDLDNRITEILSKTEKIHSFDEVVSKMEQEMEDNNQEQSMTLKLSK